MIDSTDTPTNDTVMHCELDNLDGRPICRNLSQAILDHLATRAQFSTFFNSLKSYYEQHKYITQRQYNPLYKDFIQVVQVTKDVKYMAKGSLLHESSYILNRFKQAINSGVFRPKLYIEDYKFSWTVPVNSLTSPLLYIRKNERYLGRIAEDTVFYPAKATTKEDIEALKHVLRRTELNLKLYGKQTGKCGCCGRMLTNLESIEAGIGPICAGKFGF